MAGRRLPKLIDWDFFEKLCQIMATLDDIAGCFDCSPDTIERYVKKQYGQTFAEVFKRKSSLGRVSLRRKQYELAMAGDKTMLVWLGKQHLGQTDRLASTNENINVHSGSAEVTIVWQELKSGKTAEEYYDGAVPQAG